MNMCMRDFETHDCHTNSFALNLGLENLSYFFCCNHQGLILPIVECEDGIDAFFGDHKCVSRGDGIDVQEGQMILVFPNLMTGYLTSHDFFENSHAPEPFTLPAF